MLIETIGIIASIVILISMTFKTTQVKSAFIMRCVNIVGSCIFIVYGLLLPAYSTAFLNAGITFINIYHAILLYKTLR